MADKQSVTPKRDLLSIRNFVLSLIWKNMQNFLNLYFVEYFGLPRIHFSFPFDCVVTKRPRSGGK